MLVLSRRIGESVIIGDNIKVTVLSARGANQVRIGIAAPKDVAVHREEVARRNHRIGSPEPDCPVEE